MSAAMPLPEPGKGREHYVARTAEGQNSIIPLGWKPTTAEPVPVVRCITIKKDGERCKRWSLRGYTKCRRHAGPGAMEGGNVQKYAAAVVEAARLRLVDSADDALDVLIELSQPGTAEAIRLKAATEVLDRAGIRGGFEVEISGDITVSPVDELKKRIADLRAGAATVEKITHQDDVVEGELVDDQPALFELEDDDDDGE